MKALNTSLCKQGVELNNLLGLKPVWTRIYEVNFGTKLPSRISTRRIFFVKESLCRPPACSNPIQTERRERLCLRPITFECPVNVRVTRCKPRARMPSARSLPSSRHRAVAPDGHRTVLINSWTTYRYAARVLHIHFFIFAATFSI